jgi:hypothetical protein
MVTPALEPDWQLLNDILSRGRECPSAADVLARLLATEKEQAVTAASAATLASMEKSVASAAVTCEMSRNSPTGSQR